MTLTDVQDYERGIYQVARYQAALVAQARIDHPHELPVVKVLLALEGALASSLHKTALSLGIEVVEQIGSGWLKS